MITLCINVNTKKIVDPANLYSPMLLSSKPNLVAAEPDIAELRLVSNVAGTPFPVVEGDSFDLGAKKEFSGSLLFYSAADKFEIINAEGGILRCQINTMTAACLSGVSKPDTGIYLQLRRYASGEINPTSLMLDRMFIQPAVIGSEGAPESADPEYLNTTQIMLLLAGKSDKISNSDDEYTGTAGRIYADQSTGQRYRLIVKDGSTELQPIA